MPCGAKARRGDCCHRRQGSRERGRLHLRGGVRNDRQRKLHGNLRQGPHLHADVRRVDAQARTPADGGAEHRQPPDGLHGVDRRRRHDYRHLRRGALDDGARVRAGRREARGLPQARTHVSARGARGRRSEARGAHGGDGRPVPPRWAQGSRSLLRDHEGRRHDGSHA